MAVAADYWKVDNRYQGCTLYCSILSYLILVRVTYSDVSNFRAE
jgi:hypothetical protein